MSRTRPVGDDLFEDVPDRGLYALGHALRALDVVRVALHDQPVHDERLEELERHSPGQAALVELQFGAGDDDRAAGVVHALAEEVLSEAALLAAEQVGERLEPVVVAARHCSSTPSVVYEGVHGLLEHTLFVAHYDFRGGEVNQSLQPVVPVDDPAVEVVQVAGGEPAAVELDHGTQFGRKDGQGSENHPVGPVAAVAEGFDDAHALDRLLAALAGGGLHLLAQPVPKLFYVQLAQNLEDGFGSHAGLEDAGALVAQFAVAALGEKAADAQAFEVVNMGCEFFFEFVPLFVYFQGGSVNLGFEGPSGIVRVFLGVFVHLGGFAQFGELRVEFFQPGFAFGLDSLDAVVKLLLKLFDSHCLEFGVHVGDEVLREIEHPVQVSGREVEHKAEPARGSL